MKNDRKGSNLRSVAQSFIRLRYNVFCREFESGDYFFFVTGRSKSGTTWVGNLLNTHPNIHCDTSENNFYHQDYSGSFFNNDSFFLHAQARNYLEERLRKARKNSVKISLIEKCYKLNAKRFGDKTPRQDIKLILDDFPHARVIVMLRDFRDVIVSLAFHNYRLTGSWRGVFKTEELKGIEDDFIRRHLANYSTHDDINQYIQLSEKKPTSVLMVRYENLKLDSKSELNKILGFLGAKHSSILVDRILKRNSFGKLSGGRREGEEDTSSFFRKGIIGDWKNHFDEGNVEVFKQYGGDSLILAQYEDSYDW